MDWLVNLLRQFIQAHGCARTYWVALSGGLDSCVLLHLLATLRAEFPLQLRAVYIHHGISPHATDWAAHCAAQCQALQIDFLQRSIAVIEQQSHHSLEDRLRTARYAALTALLAPHDFLLTGHHQDDQAETVLLQLFRGAGPKGLAAMPLLKKLGAGFQARPLLTVSRATLHEYALQQQLTWVEDESNANVALTRNFLRHDVLPLLKQRWPTIAKTLARVADHCAQTQDVLDTWLAPHLASVQGASSVTLSVSKLKQLPVNQQLHILRAWLMQRNLPLPSTLKLQHIVQDVLSARMDKMPQVTWPGAEVRRYRDELYCDVPLASFDTQQVLLWDMQTPLMLANGTLLTSADLAGFHTDSQTVTVRFRQGGEKLHLPGRQHQHELKKLWQTWGVPPWQRERIPLIYVGDQLAMVVGYCIAVQFVSS